MTGAETVTEAEAPEPYESETARYTRIRSEAKAEAAITMAAEAKAAQKAKDKRLRQAPEIKGLAEFNKRGREIEASINATVDKKSEEK